MPLGKIHLRPGVNVELTQTANEGGFSASQLIRFFSGMVQKYGGWSKMASVGRIEGQCRGLFGWGDLLGTPHLAAGSDQQLAVVTGGVLTDITPILSTTNAAPALATTAGSEAVTIRDTTYSPAVGDWVNLVTQVAIGTVVVSGYARVTSSSSPIFTVLFAGISPVTAGPGGAVPTYSTVNGSATVTVVMASHHLIVGTGYYVTIPTAIAGLTLFGFYAVASVIDANTFTITGEELANATTSAAENGGDMQIQYRLPSGYPMTFATSGWGVGPWGGGPWGMGTTSDEGFLIHARTWSLDHFGQDLIASPDNGAIYYWSPSGDSVPAAPLSVTSPIYNRVVFAASQVQMVMACGSESGGTYFPTLVRWCDSGDFTDWTPTTTNQAGSYQLPTGSSITSGMSIGLGGLVWTDTDLWEFTYLGLPFIFGFNKIGVGCPAISKKAPAAIANMVIWPSSRGFFQYAGGTLAPMECPVWDWFFDNLDTTQTEQICAGINSLFNEVTWFFPTRAGTISYVKFNYLENLWDVGALDRTAWCDRSPLGNPVATDSGGVVYLHETSPDADGQPLVCSAQSGYYDLQDGTQIEYVNVVIPDFRASAGSAINLTILATDYPGGPPRSYGPFTITPTTQRINVSLRGRQVAFQIGSSDLGSSWRMGAVRYSSAPAGQRP